MKGWRPSSSRCSQASPTARQVTVERTSSAWGGEWRALDRRRCGYRWRIYDAGLTGNLKRLGPRDRLLYSTMKIRGRGIARCSSTSKRRQPRLRTCGRCRRLFVARTVVGMMYIMKYHKHIPLTRSKCDAKITPAFDQDSSIVDST